MRQVSNRAKNRTQRLHQQFSQVDNQVLSAFCDSFKGIKWSVDFKDNEDEYCGIDCQLTGNVKDKQTTFDIEIKAVFLNKMLPYCFFQRDKWFSLVEWDNDIKLYFVIYTKHNKIAVWRINSDLLCKSEKDIVAMNKNTAGKSKSEKTEKEVYKLKLDDAKVFDFNLSKFKEIYDALYQQTKE